MAQAKNDKSTFAAITLDDVKDAAKHIYPVVKRTPLDHSLASSQRVGSEVFLKFENLQKTGSFKIRGAMNKVRSLTAAERAGGIIASSAGNHAQGVAFSGTYHNVDTHIVMPTNAPLVKVSATRGYGANVILHGEYYDQAYEHACKLAQEKGYTFVHPYQDPLVIAGQGTIALELLDEVADLDSVVVPIGGGGLISGIATVIKAINPKCKIYGVQTRAAPSMVESYKAKHIIKPESSMSTIADGLAVKSPSPLMYDTYISKLVDDVALVEEDEIADAIVFLMERTKQVVEGSGAVGLAAALAGHFKLGKKCAIILCGGNIDLNIVAKVIDRGLSKTGRLAKLVVAVEDRPGSLNRLTQILADHRANVIQVSHERNRQGLVIGQTVIETVVETSGPEHLDRIRTALTHSGFRIINN
jgi:threonine dehydratase